MSTAPFEHVFPWTEEEYFALGETSDRVELLDGSLFVSPAPTKPHQTISRRLANLFEPGAEHAGLEVYEAINVRLRPGRVVIPDVVVTRPSDDQSVSEAAMVELICEITSPSNAGTDRILKMHYHAEAGTPCYLLVEPDPLLLRLFRLDGGTYVADASAAPGVALRLTAPIAVDIDPAALLTPAR